MPQNRSMEEMILEDRAQQREQIGKAMATDRGPAPYSKQLSEEEQDRLWSFVAPAFRGPQGDQMLMQLTIPQEQGGGGLTPLAASYEKYVHRRRLVEAEDGIEAQIAYAQKRAERAAKKPAAPTPAPVTAPATPEPQATGIPPAEGY